MIYSAIAVVTEENYTLVAVDVKVHRISIRLVNDVVLKGTGRMRTVRYISYNQT